MIDLRGRPRRGSGQPGAAARRGRIALGQLPAVDGGLENRHSRFVRSGKKSCAWHVPPLFHQAAPARDGSSRRSLTRTGGRASYRASITLPRPTLHHPNHPGRLPRHRPPSGRSPTRPAAFTSSASRSTSAVGGPLQTAVPIGSRFALRCRGGVAVRMPRHGRPQSGHLCQAAFPFAPHSPQANTATRAIGGGPAQIVRVIGFKWCTQRESNPQPTAP
jgi:hypothetical protein